MRAVQVVRPRRRLGAPDRRLQLGAAEPALTSLTIRETDCRFDAVCTSERSVTRRITHLPSGEMLLCGTLTRAEALRELDRLVKASQWGRCYLRTSA